MSEITVEQIKAMMPMVPPASGVASHIGFDELEFVDIGNGVEVKVLHVDLRQGLWVVWNRFKPGALVGKHYHTGPVFGVTRKGRWYYQEYPEKINTAGSYLFEPAGSVHTLIVPEDNQEETEVWFAIFGANVQMDGSDNVENVVDAATMLGGYRMLCEASSFPMDPVIIAS